MCADISKLGGLNSSEPLDMDKYQDAKEGTPFPRAGLYTLRAPDSIGSEAFGTNKKGFLTAQIDPTIVGPTNEGYTIRFTRINATTFPRGKARVSQFGDYLRACGRTTGVVPSDPQELANLVEATAGSTYQAELDWRAYNKHSGQALEGMANFPRNDKGEFVPVWEDDADLIPSETETNGDGSPKMVARRVRANLNITRFVSQATN